MPAATIMAAADSRASSSAPRRAPRGVGVAPGVQLDRRDAELEPRLDLRGFRVEEQRDLDAGVAAAADRLGDPPSVADDVQPPFGRQLLTPLRDERHLVGPDLQGERDDRGLGGQLEVQPDRDGLPEEPQVAVLDVPPILAEVDGDPIGPAQLGQRGGPDRVGLMPAPRLAERGDVIDVDSQADHIHNSCVMR